MESKPVILGVDRNRRNLELLTQALSREGYRTLAATSLEELDRILTESETIRLAIVDISGFDRGIWERCERLREASIPFLLLSPRQSAALQQTGLAHGARGVLIKPLAVRELLALIRSLLGE